MPGLKRTDKKGRILKDGEIYRKSDGMYCYRYVDAEGNRRAIYSNRLMPTDKTPPGRKEDLSLREKERLVIRDLEDGIKAKVENKATLNDLFDLYMADKRELKESTRTNYLYIYDKYIRNDLGKRRISAIKYSAVKAFYNSLIHDKGFKPNSMEIVHTILHPVFTLAVRDNYIRTNPTDGVMAEIKKSNNWEKPKRHALSIQEQDAFISFLTRSPIYNYWLPLFTVLLGTGGRVGEITGLRWEDCDFEENTISINHNLVYRKFFGEEKAKFHLMTPKTSAGIRVIPMLSEVKAALQKEYEKQSLLGFNETIIDGYSGFIFQNRYGDALSAHNINRAIDRIVKAYNDEETEHAAEENREPFLIRHFSVHNLRHTFATRFCENETNLKVIQEIMGHADIETTMNIYAEATKEMKKRSMDNLEGKIRLS
jgi:integrase